MSMDYGQMYANLSQSADLRAWAEQNAQQAYYNSISAGNDASTALKQAQFAWQQKMDEATQTGMWNGQWSMPSNKYFTDTFGTWMPGGPTAGQQTMALQNQQYQMGQGYGSMYGEYFLPGTGPAAGTQTQQALQQQQQNAYTTAGLTGWYTPTQNANVSPSRFAYDAD